jgi:dipeptidyl aminopeptidase/acylaminoacyl peptidase
LIGYVLFVRGDTLMAQVFDGINGKLREEIFPIAEKVGNLAGLGVATRRAFSASTNGVLVFASGNSVDRELVWVDRAGRRLETATKRFAMARNPAIALSPDDTEIAVPVAGGSGEDYWVADLTRKTFSRFTFDGSRSAVWSPDGKRLLFAKNDGNRFLKAADGSGKEELVFKNPTCPTCYLYDWSLDGKLIAFTQPGDKGGNIWLVSAEGDHKPHPYRGSHFSETWARFSPDGRWMAYETNESGEHQIYAESIPAGDVRRQISTDGGQWPSWRRDGKELFYRQGNKMMAVPIRLTATSVEAGKPQMLFESNDDLRFQVSRDGQRFLLIFPIEGQTAFTPITVDTNWQAGQAK